MELILNQEELKQLLAEWQERLGLQDWDISIKITRAHEMALDSKSAIIEWMAERKIANVTMLDPVDYTEDLFPQDMEHDLVHELIHPIIGVVYTPKNDLEHVLSEQIIDTLAKALVTTKRCKDIRKTKTGAN